MLSWQSLLRIEKERPRPKRLSDETIALVTKGDMPSDLHYPKAPLVREVGRLNVEDGQLMVGPSANLTGRG